MLPDLKLVISVLQRLREELVCCYQGKGMCDCKYGGGGITSMGRWQWKAERVKTCDPEEQTGCPELRTAIGVLERLTEEEYASITERQPPPPSVYAVIVTTFSPDTVSTVGPFKTRSAATAFAATRDHATVIELLPPPDRGQS